MRTLLRLLVLAIVVAAVGAVALRSLDQPYQGYTEPEIFVDIPQGLGVSAIGHRLVESGVIKSDWSFRLAVWRRGAARTLKAGEYRFTGQMRASDVVDRLVAGSVFLRPVTFPEGLTIAEMAAVFETAGLGTKAMFTAAARRGSLVHEVDATADDLEGYLFPETYNLPRDAGAEMLVEQMSRRFLATYDTALRDAARKRGLTTRQVVTIASLIEKETSRPEERPLVSAVYQNRMRIGMGMQCDPTVIFALQRAGRWNGNLTRENLQFDSPYNTYRYSGLPPGPIAAPGRASLAAAVAPADVPYLYFVSRNDGSHVFASHARRAQPQRPPAPGPVFPGPAPRCWQKMTREHREILRSSASARPISVSAAGRRSRSARSSGPAAGRARRASP